MMKSMKFFAIASIVFISLLFVLGLTVLQNNLFLPHENIADSQQFTIRVGENMHSVAQGLEEAGLISSAFLLNIYARVNNLDSTVQSGEYIIPSNLSAVEILQFLSSGQQVLIPVTIPEGKTLRQVATIMESSGIVGAEQFTLATKSQTILEKFNIPSESVEGYLFPDTYHFPTNFPAEEVVEHMVSLFFKKLEDIYPLLYQLSSTEIHQYVTMASIVEREYRSSDEASTIASVFYNRLEQNIRLESCATVVYVMTEIEGLDHPKRIFFADLERSSVYNTYYTYGLPPAPISNPGYVAISAAFFPAKTDFLFFVLEDPQSNKHVFSRNYREHLIASESYYVKLN